MKGNLLLVTREEMGDSPHELQTILVINFFEVESRKSFPILPVNLIQLIGSQMNKL